VSLYSTRHNSAQLGKTLITPWLRTTGRLARLAVAIVEISSFAFWNRIHPSTPSRQAGKSVILVYSASAQILTFSRTRSTKGTGLPAALPFGKKQPVAGASSTIKGRLSPPKLMRPLLARRERASRDPHLPLRSTVETRPGSARAPRQGRPHGRKNARPADHPGFRVRWVPGHPGCTIARSPLFVVSRSALDCLRRRPTRRPGLLYRLQGILCQ
jgi:hypothetical protein